MRKIPEQAKQLLNRIGDGGCIAGSYALWLVDERAEWKPRDIDIFTFSKTDYLAIIIGLFAEGYAPLADTDNAVTLESKKHPMKVQVVRQLEGRTDCLKVLERFDIGLSKVAIYGEGEVVWTVQTKKEIESKEIRFYNSVDKVVDIKRLLKYSNKGYWFKLETLLNILGDEKMDELYADREYEAVYP